MTEVFFKLRTVKSGNNTKSSNLKGYNPRLAIIVKEDEALASSAKERSAIFSPYNDSTRNYYQPGSRKRPEITPLSISKISGMKSNYMNSKFQSSASPNTQSTGKFSHLKSSCSNGLAPTETSFEARKQENITIDAVQESLPRFNLLQKISDDINSTDEPRTNVVYAKPRIKTADITVQTRKKHIQLEGNDHYFPRGYGQALDSNSSPKSDLKSMIATSMRTNQSAMTKLLIKPTSISPSRLNPENEEVSTVKLDDKYHQIKVYNRNKNSANHLARAVTSISSAKNRLNAKRPETSSSLYYANRVELLNRVGTPGPGSNDKFVSKENASNNNLSITRFGKRDKKIADSGDIEDSGRRLSIKLYPSGEINSISKSDRKGFTIREIRKGKAGPGSNSQNANSCVSLRKIGANSKQTTKRTKGDLTNETKREMIMKRLSNDEIDALLMEMDSDFKEEVLKKWQVQLAQKSVKKVDSQNPDIGNEAIAEDCTQTKKELDTLIQHVNILMEHRAKKLQEQKPDFLAEGSNTLTEIALQIIKQEYIKKKHDENSVDYQKIADLTAQLTFFARLADHVKLDILRNATFVSYPANTTIFSQGDIGDLMYIILKGSVHVRVKKKTTYGSVENLIVNTLYDGLHFGDYAIINKGKQDPEEIQDVGQVRQKISPPMSPSKHIGRLATMALGDPNYTFKDGVGGYKNQKSVYDSPRSPLDRETNRSEHPDVAGPSRRYFKDNTKRTATVETVEHCDLLAIPREKFQNIFMDMVEEDLHDKLEILTSLPFLKKFDPFGLIPLANNLTAKEYKIGEIIQAADDSVSTFRIILRGRCKVILGVLRENNLDPPVTLHGRMASVKPLKAGTVDYSCAETAIKSDAGQAISLKKEKNSNIKRTYEPRIFNFDELGTHGNSLYYVEHAVLTSLAPADFFGGRSLLNYEDFKHEEDPFKKLNEIENLAKVSVVADSATVEILEIEKDRLKYIPEALVKILKSGLINCKEFDDYNIEEELKKNQKWREYKDKEVKDVYKRRIMPHGSTFKKF